MQTRIVRKRYFVRSHVASMPEVRDAEIWPPGYVRMRDKRGRLVISYTWRDHMRTYVNPVIITHREDQDAMFGRA